MRDPTSRPRELRIAPVMTGGTSLSVWMGGATVELYRMLSTADDDGVYARLLRVTDTRPVVDVITGTSAGGLNGAILASALAWGVPLEDFEQLREVWMVSANLDLLLWKGDTTPAALLDGNAAFVPPIVRELEKWAKAASSRASAWKEVDLVTTFTAVHPRRRTVVDDFGERLDEEVFAGTIRYRPHEFVGSSHDTRVGEETPAADSRMPALLAWGARASASIPGVFEPVYLSREDQPTQPPRPGYGDRITVGGRSLTGEGVWAVDGGLVNNLPLEDALDRIFTRRSAGPVRRVALYISPTPTDVAQPAERSTKRPAVVRSALTIVTAARAEGVGDSIDVVRDHNRAVARQRAARATLAMLEPPGGLTEEGWRSPVPGPFFARYRQRRAEESVARTLARLDDHLAATTGGLPTPRRSAVEAALLTARLSQGLLPVHLPSVDDVSQQTWAWGITPIEQAISTVLGLVNRTLSLPLRITPGDTEALDALNRLEGTKSAVHDVLEEVDEWRSDDRAYWASALPELVAGGGELTELARSLYDEWPGTNREEALAALRQLMLDVGLALAEAEPHLTVLLGRAGAQTGLGTGDDSGGPADSVPSNSYALASEAESIHLELRAVAPVSAPEEHMAEWCTVLLLKSHVLQTMLFGDVQAREQPVEVMQLSWNSIDLLSHRQPADKLCGTEFARLGAFVLPSWRANDFLWGQLDAAPRLVALLADPRRLTQLGLAPAAVLDDLGLKAESIGDRARELLESELSFMGGAAPVPDELPELTRVLTRRRQLEIARDGLPRVHAALKEAQRMGASTTPAAQSFLTDYSVANEPATWTDETVTDLLGALRLGAETMDDQLDSELVTGYVTQAAEILGRALEPLQHSRYAQQHPWLNSAVTWVQWLTKPDILIRNMMRRLRNRD